MRKSFVGLAVLVMLAAGSIAAVGSNTSGLDVFKGHWASGLYLDGPLTVGTSSALATVAISGTSTGSTGYQQTLDTGDVTTYGTLRLGHFSNGAFISTFAGSNTLSDLLRLGTNGSVVLELDHAGDALLSGTDTLDLLAPGTLHLGTSTATAVSIGTGSATTAVNGALTVGGGSTINKPLSGTKSSFAIGTVGAASNVTTTLTVTGAATTGAVFVSPTSTLPAPLTVYGYVSASNTVTIVIGNGGAAGVAGGTATFNVWVIQ